MTSSLISHKTSTCILFDKERKFRSFGFEAEAKYLDLVRDEKENHRDWYFFRRFKMVLYDMQVWYVFYKMKCDINAILAIRAILSMFIHVISSSFGWFSLCFHGPWFALSFQSIQSYGHNHYILWILPSILFILQKKSIAWHGNQPRKNEREQIDLHPCKETYMYFHMYVFPKRQATMTMSWALKM